MELPDLSGRTILVTGATSGVGRDGAVRLGARGARVLVHGRDAERGQETVAAVEAAGGEASFHPADFTDLDAVRDLAAAVDETTDGLDALCNNAGLYTTDRESTEQGFGTIFGVNHVAPYVLTRELAAHLNEGARVVNTASVAHRFASLDLDMVRRKRALTGPAVERYCESKLCNVLFTRALARRLGDATATCFHPGNIPGLVDSVEDGGRALAHLAAAPEVAGITGEYFDQREPAAAAAAAKNDEQARALWDLTADLVGIPPELPEGPATRGADRDGRASHGVRIDVTDAAEAEPTDTADGDDGQAAVEVAVTDATGGNGADDSPAAADRDLTDLDGVGPTTAEALRAAGFETVAAVRAATMEELTAADGVGPARAQRIKTDAGED